MSNWIKVENNKRQKLSNERKFNSYSAQNYISNNLNICEELCKNINTFLDKKITLIPKDILDKYFIKSSSSIDTNSYKRKGI